jgi:hypothetical protein
MDYYVYTTNRSARLGLRKACGIFERSEHLRRNISMRTFEANRERLWKIQL